MSYPALVGEAFSLLLAFSLSVFIPELAQSVELGSDPLATLIGSPG